MTVKNSAAPAEAEPQTMIDALAEDVAVPDDYPDGAPELRPYLQIRPRSKRAQYKRKLAEFEQVQAKVDDLKKSGVFGEDSTNADQLRAWADMDDMYQFMDELLALAAVDPAAYQAWSDVVDDEVLVTTFNVYMRRSQPGEASSSAN